ncbi:MAG: hypothetical protein ACYTGN_02800 [Planctomycetota bacterium]
MDGRWSARRCRFGGRPRARDRTFRVHDFKKKPSRKPDIDGEFRSPYHRDS